jgi:hypothetical protein
MATLSIDNVPEDNVSSIYMCVCARHNTMQVEKVARAVFKMTLEDNLNAPWKQDTGGQPGHGDSVPSCGKGHIMTETPSALNITEDRGRSLCEGVEEAFTTHLLINHQLHTWAQNITKLVEGLGTMGACKLKSRWLWMEKRSG